MVIPSESVNSSNQAHGAKSFAQGKEAAVFESAWLKHLGKMTKAGKEAAAVDSARLKHQAKAAEEAAKDSEGMAPQKAGKEAAAFASESGPLPMEVVAALLEQFNPIVGPGKFLERSMSEELFPSRRNVHELAEKRRAWEHQMEERKAELYMKRKTGLAVAPMGVDEGQSSYFQTMLDGLPEHLNVGDRAPVSREDGTLQYIKAFLTTTGGKLLEGVHGALVGANIFKRVSRDRSEAVMSSAQVHDGDDGRMPDLEAGILLAEPAAAGESREQLARMLMMVGHASLFVGVSAGVRQPTTAESVLTRHQAAYYGVVGAILAAVPLEVATAFWLRRSSNPRFQVFAHGLQSAGLVLRRHRRRAHP